jgi:hypothetical protein
MIRDDRPSDSSFSGAGVESLPPDAEAWVRTATALKDVYGADFADRFLMTSPLAPLIRAVRDADAAREPYTGTSAADHVDAFVAARVRKAPGQRVPARVVYAEYRAWAMGQGGAVLSQRHFGLILARRVPRTRASTVWYRDVSIGDPCSAADG